MVNPATSHSRAAAFWLKNAIGPNSASLFAVVCLVVSTPISNHLGFFFHSVLMKRNPCNWFEQCRTNAELPIIILLTIPLKFCWFLQYPVKYSLPFSRVRCTGTLVFPSQHNSVSVWRQLCGQALSAIFSAKRTSTVISEAGN